MVLLRIEHDVADYDAWKRMFDDDPVDRRGSGVRSYRVGRDADDPAHVSIDLVFDDVAAAAAMRGRLVALWDGPAREVMRDARARVVEVIDDVTL